MQRLPTLLLALLTLALAAPAAAPAKARHKTHKVPVTIGIGDQSPAMFDSPYFKRLHVHQVRMFVPWNVMWGRHRTDRLSARAYVLRARRAHAHVLLHVSTDNYAIKRGHLPSARQYRKNVGRLVRYFRHLGVRDFGAWNEVNHKSEPTWNHPKAAARYFRLMRHAVKHRCRHCRVLGLDILDQAGVTRYVRRFVHALGRGYARRYLRIVGVHNYSDVNRRRTRGLRSIMHAVHRYVPRARFWLTETGGIVKFGRSFPCNQKRAAHRLGYLFRTVKRYRRQLGRVYVYNWTGGDCQVRFDAGLVKANGMPRPAFYTMRRNIRHFRH